MDNPQTSHILDKLRRGDRRSIGRANEVVQEVLDEAERARAVEILRGYLQDESKIVKTFSMQALADLAEQDAALRPNVIQWIQGMVRTGSPAVQSRGRRLLREMSR